MGFDTAEIKKMGKIEENINKFMFEKEPQFKPEEAPKEVPQEMEKIPTALPEKGEKTLVDEYEKEVKKYFGEAENRDYEIHLRRDQQCWYFSPHSPEERRRIQQEGPDVNELQKEAVNSFAKDETMGRDINRGGGARFMAEHFDEICQEYKIHLQPPIGGQVSRQEDWRPFCVNKLLGALAENPKFRESVDCFKVSYREEAKRSIGGAIPEIIIYPRTGRENFGKALAHIYQCFKGDEQHASDITPRYNHRINELIFVAQSSGDFKDSLKRLGVLDRYFDEKQNYAFRKGEEPPLTLAGAESFQELFAALERTFPKGLQGTQKPYEVSELKKLINQVRSGKEGSNIVTKTEGLRGKVEKLLKKETKK